MDCDDLHPLTRTSRRIVISDEDLLASSLGMDADDIAVLDLVLRPNDAPAACIGGANEAVSKIGVNGVCEPFGGGS